MTIFAGFNLLYEKLSLQQSIPPSKIPEEIRVIYKTSQKIKQIGRDAIYFRKNFLQLLFHFVSFNIN